MVSRSGGVHEFWVICEVRDDPAGRLQTLLLNRWSGFGSVTLDPVPGTDAGPAPAFTTMSRSRFVRFLDSYENGAVEFQSAAAS